VESEVCPTAFRRPGAPFRDVFLTLVDDLGPSGEAEGLAKGGPPAGTVMIHALTYTTMNASTGGVTGSVDKFFFTCG
jgi:hypothetical protein